MSKYFIVTMQLAEPGLDETEVFDVLVEAEDLPQAITKAVKRVAGINAEHRRRGAFTDMQGYEVRQLQGGLSFDEIIR